MITSLVFVLLVAVTYTSASLEHSPGFSDYKNNDSSFIDISIEDLNAGENAVRSVLSGSANTVNFIKWLSNHQDEDNDAPRYATSLPNLKTMLRQC